MPTNNKVPAQAPIPFADDAFAGVGELQHEVGTGGAGDAFGKFNWTSVRYIKWDKGQPSDVTPQEFATLEKGRRTQEFELNVDVQELNPTLQKTFNRKINVGGPDWEKSWLPGLVNVFGADATSDEKLGATLRSLQGRYVQMTQVDQQPRKNGKHLDPEGKVWRTYPQLVKVFANVDECDAARIEMYGDADGIATVGQNADIFDQVKDDADFRAALEKVKNKKGPALETALKEIADEWLSADADYNKSKIPAMKALIGLK